MATQADFLIAIRGIDNASAALNSVAASLGRLEVKAASAGPSFGKMAGAMTLGGVAANAITGVLSSVGGAMLQAGQASLGLASRLEQARIGFTTMLGSAQKADVFIGKLQSFAESTAFDFPGIQQVAQSFLAMGVEAKNVIPLVQDVSNALSAAGKGGDTDALQRVGASLSEIAAQGKVTGEQLREMSRNGIAVLPLLAEAFGKTTAEVRKMAENGEISAKQFFEAFHSQVAQNYGDIGAEQAKTWAVAVSNLGDIMGRISTDVLKEFFETLTRGALALNDFLHSDRVLQWAADFKASIHEVLTALQPLLSAIGVGPAAAAAPKVRAAPATSAQARDDWRVPPEAIKSAKDYADQVKDATAKIHDLTAELTALSAQQDALKNTITDVTKEWDTRLAGLKARQDANNASIETTKEKYEALLEPLQRQSSQLQRLGEDTKKAFSNILDPLKDQLDGINTKISDAKAAYQALITPIERQIASINKVTAALTKQREIQGQIADLALRQSALNALGDPNKRADIAGKLKALELAREEIERNKELLELGNGKGKNDKAIAAAQASLDANKRSQLQLEQQLFGLVDKGATAEIAKQEVLNKAKADQLAIDKEKAELAANAQKAPLEAQLQAAKEQLASFLDPLEAQAASITKLIEGVSKAEADALRPITEAQDAVARRIQDTSAALTEALKPLEQAQKDIARQIAEAEAGKAAALAPLKDELDALDRKSNALDLQKRILADQIAQIKESAAALKDEATQAAAVASALDLSGGKGAAFPVLPGGLEGPVAPKVGVSLIPPETIQSFKDAAAAMADLGKAWDDLLKALAPLNIELDKLNAKFGKDSPASGPDAAKIAAWQKFGAVVLAVITSEIDALNTWADVFSLFGTGMAHELQALQALWKGDVLGFFEQDRIAGEAFGKIPGTIGAWQQRSLERLRAGVAEPSAIATETWSGYVTSTDTALLPLGPTIQEAIDNGAKILPQLPAAVVAQQEPMETAATALGGAVDAGVAPGIATAVENAVKDLPGIPKAVTDQHAVMLAEATTLGGNLPKGVTAGVEKEKLNTDQVIGNWILDLVKKFDPLKALFTWFEQHWPGANPPKVQLPGVGGGNLQTSYNPGQGGSGAGGGEIEQYIRQSASLRNIDGNIAVLVAKAEGGLLDPVRQSDVVNGGRREQSYGPFQLNINGGLGATAIASGIDPRNEAQWRAAVDYALDQVSKGGWEPFHGAAAAGIGNWQGVGSGGAAAGAAAVAGVRNPGVPAPRSQFALTEQGLSADEAAAACGPYAAMLFANAAGRYPTAQETIELARAVGWTPGQGMAGTGSELALIQSLGLSASQQAPTSSNINAALGAGNSVALSTPDHYFRATGGTAEGGLDVGSTGTALKGGKSVMTLAEIEALSGPLQGIIVVQKELNQAQTVGAQVAAAQAAAQAGLAQIMNGGVASTSALGAAQQEAVAWAQQMEAQQAALNATLAQQVPPGRAAADAMEQLGSVLGPVERQIAAGTISADTLRGTLLNLAKATGLADQPWQDFATGALDANGAMDELIATTAVLGPEFQAVADYQKTAGSSSNEAALRWLQAAQNYAKAKEVLAAAPDVPAAPTANAGTKTGPSPIDVQGASFDALKPKIDAATESLKGYQTVVQGLDPSKIAEQAAAWDTNTEAVGKLSDGLHNLADFLDKHDFHVKVTVDDIPDWATPGSPTPFEMGLRGIARAAADPRLRRIPIGIQATSPLSFGGRAPRLASTGGGGSGDTHYHVTIEGTVTSEDQLLSKFRNGLIKTGRRNGGRVLD